MIFIELEDIKDIVQHICAISDNEQAKNTGVIDELSYRAAPVRNIEKELYGLSQTTSILSYDHK